MVSKTLELRKVITKLLKEVNKNVFYENATDEAEFPYIVYEIDSISFDYSGRDDVILTINVWDKDKESKLVESVSDEIEKKLNYLNYPTGKVLPTFYLINRISIPDEDKSIRRRELKFQIQNYYIGE